MKLHSWPELAGENVQMRKKSTLTARFSKSMLYALKSILPNISPEAGATVRVGVSKSFIPDLTYKLFQM